MVDRVVPMIHVPDVPETVDWYKEIGFTLVDSFEECGELSFAMLSLGASAVMLNAGGEPSARSRREVDLYVYTDDVAPLHARIKDRVEIVESLHDTFYGMREFTIRDINGFWVIFGQSIAVR